MASLGAFFKKWLHPNDVVLEAGCGTGIWVQRFRNRGYRCIGLDFAVQTLLRSKKIVPDISFIGGDIYSIPFMDGTLDAVVSFGVVEHFPEGPDIALREFSRVLKPGGIALISVPYENPFRASKLQICDEQLVIADGAEFYQYYFKPEDLFNQLRISDLTPKTEVLQYYGVHRGLQEQSKIINKVFQFLPLKSAWTPILDFIPYLPRYTAHMFFAVCEKVK